MIPADDLEVAVLDRTRTQPRKFRRLGAAPCSSRSSATGAPPSTPTRLPGPNGTPETPPEPTADPPVNT